MSNPSLFATYHAKQKTAFSGVVFTGQLYSVPTIRSNDRIWIMSASFVNEYKFYTGELGGPTGFSLQSILC